MKTTITLALILLMTFEGISQTFITQAKPYGEKEWGYINQKGETVIAPMHKKCFQFSEDGLAAIYEAKQYYFINTKGEKITTEINGFGLIAILGLGVQGYYNGMVAVRIFGKWGFMNTEGKITIKFKYDKVTYFDNGYAIAKIEDDFFVINKQGIEILIKVSGILAIKHFSEGLAPFKNSEKMHGFINTTGKVIIPAKFMSVGYFSGGLAWAKTMDKKVGYINKKGEWVIQPQFVAVKDFDPVSGLARVTIDDKVGYVNKSGKIIYMDDCDVCYDFSEGLAKGKKGDKVGYFDNTGKWVIAPEFEGGRDFKNGFVAVKKGEKWGFINKIGEWVVEPIYANVKDLELVK